jgi:hypothetical protein
MGRNLEEQMRLSLRAILSKQMTGEGEDKHRVIASFISDDSGFPLTGLRRIEGFISESEESEVNHLTIGFKKKGSSKPHLEMMVTRLDELFLTSIFLAKK